MIHEAMVLEYSARHLALIEWAAALRLLNHAAIGLALFVPFGLAAPVDGPVGVVSGAVVSVLKLALVGAGLAVIETMSAKLRIFRAPEFLATAFLLAVLGLLVHQLLGS
jgi:formate hydrogenlyase subunit 4